MLYWLVFIKSLETRLGHNNAIYHKYMKFKNAVSQYQLGTNASPSHVIHDEQGRRGQLFELFSLHSREKIIEISVSTNK